MSDLEGMAQARVGQMVRGKYRLDALIGVGGMAAVYAATHRVGNRVALKMLHPHMSLNTDVRARFLREGYVANSVVHPGAVRVLDDDTAEDGSVFLAMELLEGETLDTRWRRLGERLPVMEVAELTYQLLDVLATAHAKGVVHRDIKPENVFLTSDGVVKVLDFGIARLAGAAAPMAATRTGRTLGSPAFMGPEQALGLNREVDGQSDVWSVGATMFSLISGQYVHDAETVEAMVVYTGSRPARSLRTVAPRCPTPLVEIVDRALAFHKAERWGSARAMQTALGAAAQLAFGRALAAPPTSRASVVPSRGDAPGPPTPTLAQAPLGVGTEPALARPPALVTSPEPAHLAFLAATEDVTQNAPNPLFGAAKSASTTAGTSHASEPVPVVTAGRSGQRAAITAGAVLVGVAIAGGAGVYALRGSGMGAASTPSQGSLPAPPSSVSEAAPTPPQPQSGPSSDSPQPPTISISDLPLVPAQPGAHGSAPGASLQAVNVRPAITPALDASTRPPVGAPAVGSAPAAAPVAPDCNPNFFYDTGGNKIFKPECFLKKRATP